MGDKEDGMRLGLDIGGSKIEANVLDAQGNVVFKQRIETPRTSYQELLQAIHGLVVTAEGQLDRRCTVGAGIPGSPDPDTGLVRNANLQILNGHDLARDLGTMLAREVRVANDANCFALSEAVDGAARKARVVFGVILGTGCGGGVVIDGKVWAGANGLGGEWGHNPLPFQEGDDFPGPSCYCGRRGCLESYVSGSGLQRDFAQATGRTLKGRDIVAAAAAGDGAAEAALQRLERRLAQALAVVINILDPQCIVLGGGLSLVPRLYTNVPKLWSQHVFGHDAHRTLLAQAVHGDASGVRGAAWLWPEANR